MSTFQLRPLREDDRSWVNRFIEDHWLSKSIVARGRVLYPDTLPGFVAEQSERPVGLVTYRIEGGECEVVTINSVIEGMGIGSALMSAVKASAVLAGCERLWLITTNDNVRALRFYQRRGFALVAVYRNALEESRRLKPEIPLVGMHGIPLRDEIELELRL